MSEGCMGLALGLTERGAFPGEQVSALVELKQIRDASSMGSAYLAAAVEAASSENAVDGT